MVTPAEKKKYNRRDYYKHQEQRKEKRRERYSRKKNGIVRKYARKIAKQINKNNA